MKTVVCGAGTLGSRLVEHLARLGWTSLAVIDDDRVEERNLKNQSYFRHQVGQPKVTALAENVFRSLGTELRLHKKRLNENNARALLDADLVVDCFDNHHSRAVVQAEVRRGGRACLHLGISPHGYGEVLWDEDYRVPPDSGQADPCADPISSTLSLLTVGMAAKVLEDYARCRDRRNYTLTTGDLAVLGWESSGSVLGRRS